MKHIFIFCASLILLSLNSCQKEFSGSDDSIPVDGDAKGFLDSANIVDASEINAIKFLVKELKDSALWDKFVAIYPMVGGTAMATKLNLKDPRNADAAYRLTYNGNPIFASTGVLFPTNNDYADTHLYDSILAFNDNAISFFSRTQNSVSGYDIGCDNEEFPWNQMAIYHETDGSGYFGLNIWNYHPPVTIGLFMFSATANDVIWYENGIPKFYLHDAPVNVYTKSPYLIGFCKSVESGGHRECAFATIGKGLSDAEALTFSNIVHEFNNRLSR